MCMLVPCMCGMELLFRSGYFQQVDVCGSETHNPKHEQHRCAPPSLQTASGDDDAILRSNAAGKTCSPHSGTRIAQCQRPLSVREVPACGGGSRAYWTVGNGQQQKEQEVPSRRGQGLSMALRKLLEGRGFPVRRGVIRPVWGRLSERISWHAVALAFLIGEYKKIHFFGAESPTTRRLEELVASPNLTSDIDNTLRSALLGKTRLPILLQMPSRVEWHRIIVDPLDLGLLRVIWVRLAWVIILSLSTSLSLSLSLHLRV